MARRIRLTGLRSAVRAIERVPEAMREARTETLHEWAENVQETAEERVPQRTGDLWQSLDSRVAEEYGRAEVGVWDEAQLEYALYVEKGTSSMADQPYLVPAFNEHRRQVVRTYRAAFRRQMGAGMTVALWPLQQAVYAKLTADAALMGLVSGVYDEVPEQVVHPYVSIGSITETVADAHNRRGLDVALVLHVWSKYRGYREAAQILAALDAVLDRQPLTVAGFRDVSIAHEQHQALRDPDPEIRHINISYRVWLTRI